MLRPIKAQHTDCFTRLYYELMTTHIEGVSSCLDNSLDQFAGGAWAPLDMQTSSKCMLQDTEGQSLVGARCCWLAHHRRVDHAAGAGQTNLTLREAERGVRQGVTFSWAGNIKVPKCRFFWHCQFSSPPRYWALAPVVPAPLRMLRNCSPTCFSTVWSTPKGKTNIINLTFFCPFRIIPGTVTLISINSAIKHSKLKHSELMIVLLW